MIKYVKPYSDSDDYEIGEVMKDYFERRKRWIYIKE